VLRQLKEMASLFFSYSRRDSGLATVLYALERHKKIIPVAIQPLQAAAAPEALRDVDRVLVRKEAERVTRVAHNPLVGQVAFGARRIRLGD
jgi:hypothetical protein